MPHGEIQHQDDARDEIQHQDDARDEIQHQDDARDEGKIEDELGRLVVEDERSRYVSGSSWTNLANQVCINFVRRL